MVMASQVWPPLALQNTHQMPLGTSFILDSAVEVESTRLRSQLRGAEASTAESRFILFMPADAIRKRRLKTPWARMALGCSLLWSLSCHAEDTHPPLSPMRAEAIAGFSYDAKADSRPDRTVGLHAENTNGDPVDSTVVVMDPVVVRTDRGLSPQQFRTLDSTFQQQAKVASEPKLPFVKVHEFKLSRKLYFGYVSVLAVPVVAGFSW